jgi:hypothetical protein
VTPPTEEDIAQLLDDPACPWLGSLEPSFSGHLKWPLAKPPDFARLRVIPVDWFLDFARSRGVTAPAVEVTADAYVQRLGGSRVRANDPCRPIRNAVHRLRRRPPEAHFYVWVLPHTARNGR